MTLEEMSGERGEREGEKYRSLEVSFDQEFRRAIPS